MTTVGDDGSADPRTVISSRSVRCSVNLPGATRIVAPAGAASIAAWIESPQRTSMTSSAAARGAPAA